MPLYEYICEACGHRFEVIQKFSDAPLDKCPKCGGAVRKLQSAPAFQFKGSGWYITDYARKDQAPSTKADGSSTDSSTTPEKTDKKDGSTEKKDTPAAAEKPAAKTSDATASTSKASTTKST